MNFRRWLQKTAITCTMHFDSGMNFDLCFECLIKALRMSGAMRHLFQMKDGIHTSL